MASLEREIAINIQKKRILTDDGAVAGKKTPVVKMDEDPEKLPKKKKKLIKRDCV